MRSDSPYLVGVALAVGFFVGATVAGLGVIAWYQINQPPQMVIVKQADPPPKTEEIKPSPQIESPIVQPPPKLVAPSPAKPPEPKPVLLQETPYIVEAKEVIKTALKLKVKMQVDKLVPIRTATDDFISFVDAMLPPNSLEERAIRTSLQDLSIRLSSYSSYLTTFNFMRRDAMADPRDNPAYKKSQDSAIRNIDYYVGECERIFAKYARKQ